MPPEASLQTRKKIYQSLCYVLSDRADQVAWDEFTPADWDLFSQMADREGVAPLMYWKLKDSPVAVPPSTFNFLRSTYYQTLAQNTLMYQELERILKALDEAGIPVIVLKGAALAATVYEDIGLRPMGDLDLLVHRQDFEKAEQIVRSVGYEPTRPELFPGINRKLAHEISLVGGKGGNTTVELHWGIIAGDNDQRSPEMARVWEQTEVWRARGHVLVLSPIMTILYLSAHQILQHGSDQFRLIWLYDIHLLFRCNGEFLDYDQLLNQAHELHWSSTLFETMERTQERFGTPVENGVFNQLILEEEKAKNFEGKKTRPGQTRSEKILERMAYLDLQSRVIWVLAKIFPSPDHMKWHYNPQPAWLWPIYYPYRWVDISIDILVTGILRVKDWVEAGDQSGIHPK
jgi:hypothetical protein